MLAAISASAWFDCGNAVASIDTDTDSEVAELLCYEAARWLIGTSVSQGMIIILVASALTTFGTANVAYTSK